MSGGRGSAGGRAARRQLKHHWIFGVFQRREGQTIRGYIEKRRKSGRR
jgi:hypothetical protein